jgi:hypothetical protein
MRRLALCLATLVAIGCGGGDDATAPASNSIAGTWALETVNGAALPFVVAQSGANKAEVTSDVLTLAEGGSFTQSTQVRLTQSGTVTTQSASEAGTWTLTGTSVSFRFTSDGSVGTGTLNGSTLTVAETGIALVYRKQ